MTKHEYIAAVWKYLEAEWPEKVIALLKLISEQKVKNSAVDVWILNCQRKQYSVVAAAGRVANLTSTKAEKGGLTEW
jgi:hypothetical protein